MDEGLIGIRAVHFAATAMTAGAVVFGTLVAEPALRTVEAAPATATAVRARLACVAWIALALAALSGPPWLMVVAGRILGQGPGDTLSTGAAWTVLAETQFGHTMTVRLGVALALAVAMAALAATDGTIRAWRRWPPSLLAAALLGALAWTGHSGARPGAVGDFQLVCDILHLLAAGAWVGGLLPLALVLSFARRSMDRGGAGLAAAAAHRFSTLGMVAVATLTVTGIVNTWILVGSVSALVETDYGRLLTAKVMLFAIMLSVAAINRLRLVPRLDAAETVRRLQRNSLMEVALGLAVIAIVGALGTIEPAVHEMMMEGPHMH